MTEAQQVPMVDIKNKKSSAAYIEATELEDSAL